MATTVEDVMTRDVVTVPFEASFRDAVRVIEERHVHAVPVVDSEGRPVGIVSEGDLLLKEEMLAGTEGFRGVPWQRRRDRLRASARSVREAMSKPVVTIGPTATVGAAARLLHRRHIGRLPVLDADGRLVGIVTRSDLLRVFLRDDAALLADAQETLLAMGGPVAGRVRCSVADGFVTLEGDVERRSQAVAALRATRAVPGVIDVDSKVRFTFDDVDVAMVGP